LLSVLDRPDRRGSARRDVPQDLFVAGEEERTTEEPASAKDKD
jgi:hypothetical protein